MLTWLIHASIRNRVLVLMLATLLAAAGIEAIHSVPVDALPDLSDTQVIVRAQFAGQPPDIVQNQVSYPLATAMLAVPMAKTVRAYSLYGDAYIYIIFDEGTDLYWARSRVLESLSQVQGRLPPGVNLTLGPDATGVGWIYEYALIDRTGQHDISQLRALQDWFLRYQLKTVPNVAEVASLGGMVKQYQVVVDPIKLASFQLTTQDVVNALKRANQEVGGSVIEIAQTDFMVRSHGYLSNLEDFRNVPLRTISSRGTVVRLGDVARVSIGPQMRQGVAELDGRGEVAGGVVLLRSGKNAMTTLQGVKARLAQLQKSLPPGVEIVPTYDRSALIQRAVDNLQHKLIEEFMVVALVTLLFLGHLRSSLVAIISLPLGVLMAFIVMNAMGINANIMSLGGIAIAVGAMIDAAVVLIENAHKHLEHWQHQNPGQVLTGESRWQLIAEAACEVGPALFFSLLIITFSFIPVFTLQGQEGKLFAPLAYTKTLVMAAAALLAVTVVPVLMGYWIRGDIASESSNPLNRWLIRAYQPILLGVLRHPILTIAGALLIALSSWWPWTHIGGEFLPPLDEGTLLYMPSALPGMSAEQASHLLQITDRMIKNIPEVDHVFGKAGRADTATDPAPMEMFETMITFKPHSQWRPGMTPEKLRDELDRHVRVPGLTNLWVPPIRNRIDMLSTGIKSPVGIKINGQDLQAISRVSQQVARVALTVPGVSSAFAERLEGGHYIDIDIDRVAAGRYGMNIDDVQDVIRQAVGGADIGETIEGVARYPINVRYPQSWRDSPRQLNQLLLVTPTGQHIDLNMIAHVHVVDGPAMLRSEDGLPSNWLYVDIAHRDLASVVLDLKKAIDRQVPLPPGVSITYAGQFESMQHAAERLHRVIPATLVIIFILLYLTFQRMEDAWIIMLSMPLALSGGIWLVKLLGYNMSVAVAVGFIALAGVAAEFGVVMILYLRQAMERQRLHGLPWNDNQLREALREGAVQRVRPKAMTVAVILAGLTPVLLGSGTGSEIMRRIAAPMIGGMITAPLLSMLLIPAIYWLRYRQGSEL